MFWLCSAVVPAVVLSQVAPAADHSQTPYRDSDGFCLSFTFQKIYFLLPVFMALSWANFVELPQ